MLTFAAFLPHPPIIIPQIGGEESKKCHNTLEAFNRISQVAEKSEIETLVIVSPHTAIHPSEMTISFNEYARGDFSAFKQSSLICRKEIDMTLAEEIYKSAKKGNIPTRLLKQEGHYNIDHASLVPLTFLEKHIPSSLKVIIIGTSLLDRQLHLNFGGTIHKAISKIGYNVGVVFSGDLSHKNFEEGAEFIGQKFDKDIVSALSTNDIEKVLKIDEFLQEEAGECGYQSLLIALGLFREYGLSKIKSEVLSYEAPFGVGYMVAIMDIKS